jgi:hypothetical protein
MFNNFQSIITKITTKETDRRGFLAIVFGLFTFFSFNNFFTVFNKPKPEPKEKGGYGV